MTLNFYPAVVENSYEVTTSFVDQRFTRHQFYPTASHVTFHLMACADTFVALSKEPFHDFGDQFLEIIFGAAMNTETKIRKNGEDKVSTSLQQCLTSIKCIKCCMQKLCHDILHYISKFRCS